VKALDGRSEDAIVGYTCPHVSANPGSATVSPRRTFLQPLVGRMIY
jgi:hypothetical protein